MADIILLHKLYKTVLGLTSHVQLNSFKRRMTWFIMSLENASCPSRLDDIYKSCSKIT